MLAVAYKWINLSINSYCGNNFYILFLSQFISFHFGFWYMNVKEARTRWEPESDDEVDNKKKHEISVCIWSFRYKLNEKICIYVQEMKTKQNYMNKMNQYAELSLCFCFLIFFCCMLSFAYEIRRRIDAVSSKWQTRLSSKRSI